MAGASRTGRFARFAFATGTAHEFFAASVARIGFFFTINRPECQQIGLFSWLIQ
jgi:hypothetical protein